MFVTQGMFIIGVSENEPSLVVSFLNDGFHVVPCKINYNESAAAPFTVGTGKGNVDYDKLGSAIIYLQQLSMFYPGVDKYEMLKMMKC